MPEKQKFIYPYDSALVLAVLALVALGLVMVFSASSAVAQQDYKDGLYFLKRQAVAALLGTVVLFGAKYIPYQRYRLFVYPALGLAAALLVLVQVPGVGRTVGGASRWLNLGSMSFQPSELAKLALVLYMAYSLDKKAEYVRSFSRGYAPHLVVCGVLAALILPQPDLGMAVIICAITAAMLFIGGANLLHLAVTGLAVVPGLVYTIIYTPWRMNRVLMFMDPWQDPLGRGFQIIHSFFAFGSGGLFGAGIGEGKQKLFYLPEPHTDFIFSVLGEELGFIGVVVVLALYGYLLYRMFIIARQTADRFGYYFAMGIAFLVGFPTLVHLGVVLGLMPTKGMALPLMSYGGSSLVLNMAAVGVMLNINGQNRKIPKR